MYGIVKKQSCVNGLIFEKDIANVKTFIRFESFNTSILQEDVFVCVNESSVTERMVYSLGLSLDLDVTTMCLNCCRDFQPYLR